MYMKNKVIGLGMSASLLFSGCASGYELDRSQESLIIDKEFIEEHEDTYEGPPCQFSSDGFCFIYTTYTRTVEDEWNVTIEQCDDGFIRKETNNCDQTEIEVTKIEFESVDMGSVVKIIDDELKRIPR